MMGPGSFQKTNGQNQNQLSVKLPGPHNDQLLQNELVESFQLNSLQGISRNPNF